MTLTYKLNLGKVTLNDNAKYLQCRSKVISFDSNHTVTHTHQQTDCTTRTTKWLVTKDTSLAFKFSSDFFSCVAENTSLL